MTFDELSEFNLKTETIDGKRHYVTPEGNKYPSVTSVTGLLTKKHIQAWRKRVGEKKATEISSRASRRGTSFHTLCEKYLRNEEFEFDNPLQEMNFKSMIPLLDKIEPFAIESAMYSDHYRIAGRCDCVGLFRGELAIIDFKTSNKAKTESRIQSYLIQESAYAACVKEMTGEMPKIIVTLISVDEDSSTQLFVDEPDRHLTDLAKLRTQYYNLYEKVS
jgi:hypothetical protein